MPFHPKCAKEVKPATTKGKKLPAYVKKDRAHKSFMRGL